MLLAALCRNPSIRTFRIEVKPGRVGSGASLAYAAGQLFLRRPPCTADRVHDDPVSFQLTLAVKVAHAQGCENRDDDRLS